MNEPLPTLTILLVEDDDVAAESVLRSLARAGLDYPTVWAEDGEQALLALRGGDAARRVPRPRVTLLDLNMPRMNGFEFLQALRADAELADDVVFVLTTSEADADRVRAYHEHIAGYMVKASVGPHFSRLAQLLSAYQHSICLP
jgi:CheY-like chemotaxis protein